MSTRTALKNSCDCLDSIYKKGAFSNVTLNEVLNKTPIEDKPLVTKIVYGVLDNDIRLDYYIRQFAPHPSATVLTMLKIGAYCITKLNLPSAIAVNDCVEVLKKQGKTGLCGFVNAVLRNISRAYEADSLKLPGDPLKATSVKSSLPVWALKKLRDDYGQAAMLSFANHVNVPSANLRIDTGTNSVDEVKSFLDKEGVKYADTVLPDALQVFGDVTSVTEKKACVAMSLAAMLVARTVGVEDGDNVLDCCAAPGGKSVYMANLCPTARILSCDVYPHKLKLIEGYAYKMKAENISVKLNDATAVNPQFIDKFDKVLLDAPCSGYGVIFSRPDIKVFRKQEDVAGLAKIQRQMLSVAKNYVKKGGTLVYSTCTVFQEENGDNIKWFLAENPDFELTEPDLPLHTAFKDKPGVQLMPDVHGTEGFYMAKLIRKI